MHDANVPRQVVGFTERSGTSLDVAGKRPYVVTLLVQLEISVRRKRFVARFALEALACATNQVDENLTIDIVVDFGLLVGIVDVNVVAVLQENIVQVTRC